MVGRSGRPELAALERVVLRAQAQPTFRQLASVGAMSLEWDGLPGELLPPGWSIGPVTPGRVVFRCDDEGLSLEAVRVDADDSDLRLGVHRGWELQLCYAVGECVATDSLLRASTRAELLEELRSRLESLQRHLPDGSDPFSFCRLLGSESESG